MKKDPFKALREMGVTMSVVERQAPPIPPKKRGKATPRKAVVALRKLLRDQHGLSACSIVWALVPELRDFVDGMTGGDLGNPPWDPSDFTRCQRVLALIPSGKCRIGEVAKAFPKSKVWARLATAWPELDKLWSDEEMRADRMAPRLYARMQELTR
jgi:hypothetical protein